MLIRIDNHIINTDRIVEAFVSEAREEYVNGAGEDVPAAALRVVLSMTGLDEEGNGREIRLYGSKAEKFLAATPIYEPVGLEEE